MKQAKTIVAELERAHPEVLQQEWADAFGVDVSTWQRWKYGQFCNATRVKWLNSVRVTVKSYAIDIRFDRAAA